MFTNFCADCCRASQPRVTIVRKNYIFEPATRGDRSVFHMTVSALPAVTPCPGFAVSVTFPDVEPDVLAREEATEARRVGRRNGDNWHTYLCRVLPALERESASDLAEALLVSGHTRPSARRHVLTMRRRSVASGDARRVRFWAEALSALECHGALWSTTAPDQPRPRCCRGNPPGLAAY
jgi:hypothetical protein